MLELFLILYVLSIPLISALAGRAHGSGEADGWPTWDRIVAKAWMGLVMGTACFALYGVWWLAVIGAGITVMGLSRGHGRVYKMTGADLSAEPEWLEKVFGRFYRGDIQKPLYSWFIMGIKGGLVAFPIMPIGLLICFLWPASYYMSFTYTKRSEPAEWASCGFAGFLAAVVILVKFLGV